MHPVPPMDECFLEQRAKVLTTQATKLMDEPGLLQRYSSLQTLLRITAWCRRWLPSMQTERSGEYSQTGSVSSHTLRAKELDEAERTWIRWVQGTSFTREKSTLSRGDPIPTGSPLKDSYHRRALHAGVQLTLSTMRRKYWVLRRRSIVKSHIRQCVTCARWRAASSTQLMADLPRPRVIPSRPFQYIGVDYAGPVLLRATPGRGHKTTKVFWVVFVCLSTRAVHLDVASNYSAEAFLAAFRRFVSRRGMCTQIFSDCGTNFVGVDAELRRLFSAHSKKGRIIANELADSRVEWRFNPPAAPHFGGLWETAVKSTKHHLRRVVGVATLTYEEMATLLTQIEACLNSRPLSTLSDDPEDLTALTPGHFLVGSALTAIPEPSLQEVPVGRLSRWQQLQQMRDHFWSRWSQEYLQTLLPRTKWQQATDTYTQGRLCLLRQEATPPARWPLARILRVHRGADGHTRVVTVKTATSELVRPISKLVLLPVAADQAGLAFHTPNRD